MARRSRARTGPPGAAQPALSPRPGPPCSRTVLFRRSSLTCPCTSCSVTSPRSQLAQIPHLLAGPAGPCLGAPACLVPARPLTLSPHRQAAAA